MSEQEFKAGDTVRVSNHDLLYGGDFTRGLVGIVRGYSKHTPDAALVQFKGFPGGHDGNGYVDGYDVPSGNFEHWFIAEEDLTLVEDEQPVVTKRPHLSPLCSKVLKHIERCGHITARDAMIDLDITSASLARRICDLEDAGINITRLAAVNRTTGKQYTRYSLAKVA